MKKITKAVFPVAGLGTRFLPATKANPKEMLPIVDKPLIQYAVEEAITAGITELIFITGKTKKSITNHFDKAHELEIELEKQGKTKELEIVRNIIPDNVTCIYIRQSEPLGLGHAVLCAEHAVGEEPFVVILPDDLIDNDNDVATAQLIHQYDKTESSVVAVQNITKEETSKYGVIEKVSDSHSKTYKIKNIIEKPDPEESPSTLGVVGRYALSPKIFKYLKETEKGAGNEIQLTDAIKTLIKKESVYACELEGVRYDCGSKFGYMQASVKYALKDKDISEKFLELMKTIIK